MSVHVDEMTSEVDVVDGELPLTPAQIDRLVKLVISRLAANKRDASQQKEATAVSGGVTPALHRD